MSFTPPIGTPEERASGDVWPGRWNDANPYLNHYDLGYHTGADLNLNFPHFDMNAHSPVVAMGDGVVTFAQLFSTSEWGNLIVIDHGVVDGKPLFSRYGHVENIQVKDGQTVHPGDPISDVGNGENLFPYHLHFDISRTDILRDSPGYWPGESKGAVLTNFVDPQEWLQDHLSANAGMIPNTGMMPQVIPAQTLFVIATLGLRVRQDHSTSALQVGAIPFGTRVRIEDASRVDQDGFTWGHIRGGSFSGDWIALGKADHSESFVSRNPLPL